MDSDMIPVRDPGGGKNISDGAAQQRRMVSKWDRDTLEDKYLRMYEENLILKKHARKQEDKIKRMATKLLRLVNDKKKTDNEGVTGKKGKDIETEEKIEELHDRLRDMDKQNIQLKEKLMLAKQQLATNNKRQTPYTHVGSRINTGIAKTTPQPDSRLAKNMRVIGPQDHHHVRSQRMAMHSPGPQYGHSLLEDARLEIRRREDHINQLQEQLNMYEMEMENMKQQLKLRESEYEEDLVKIKQQITAEQRVTVQENIDMIKLQREVKEKSTKLMGLQEKYVMLEENFNTVKRSHDGIIMEMENLNMQLKEEQNRVLTLQNEIKFGTANNRRLIELQEQVSSMEKENQILKEANEKFVSSAFDLEREREWRQRENALKVQIAQLEATLKADLGEKGGIIDKYAREREQHEKLQQEYREMQIQHYQMKEEHDDIKEKMKFFTKESAVDFTEIEEALVLVKQKKQKAIPQPEFLQRVDTELSKDASRQLLELQAEYAETIHELEKTRNMLVVQHKINKDYQQEVQLCTSKMDDVKKEYEMKLDEYARLLDIRAARIKKLEAQLRDVAYGTKQYKIMPPADEEDTMVEFDETVHLERGQNLFEIHISKINLSPEALKLLNDEEPCVFCTWEFFEYEIQSTPVLRGPKPEYDFTSQYIVKVDDFFLHYLQRESCTLELHQSFGQDYRTIAACQLTFKDIFDKTHGRIHGTATLTCVDPDNTGLGFGTVEYWIRLRVPMEQALRLYKERTKALGYLTINDRAAEQALEALDETAAKRPKDNINELHIKLIRCSKIKPRRENVQPSPYCVYQFFDYNDHDTVILSSTNNPEFNDHKTYPVPMTGELDTYLKTVALKIFVFDDTDPEQTAYLGIADIPLIPLAHNKGVTGVFELKTADGGTNGTVEVELRWQFTYVSPKSVGVPPAQEQTHGDAAPQLTPEKLVSEEPKPPPGTPSHQRPRMAAKFPQPSATSTPMAKQPEREGAKKKLDIEPSDSMVNEAVSRVISDIMPQTGLSDTVSSETMQVGHHEEVDAVQHRALSEEHVPSGARTPVGDAQESSEEEEETEEEMEEEIEEEEVEEDIQEETMPTPLEATGDTRTDETAEGGKKVKPKPRSRKKLLETKEETTMSPKAMSDTMFEEERTESLSEELVTPSDAGTTQQQKEPPRVETESESDRPVMESDSEGLVMVAPTPAKRRQRAEKRQGDTVSITISHLSLDEAADVEDNRQLFAAYNFLGIAPQELETPISLPKPKQGQVCTFNFSKSFKVDLKHNYERRQYLASMLLPDDPDKGRIRFNVVSEPPEEDLEGDCEDVGVAFVSVKDILKNKKDVVDQNVDLYDIEDEETVIGVINVTVQCLAALEAVEKELSVEGTY